MSPPSPESHRYRAMAMAVLAAGLSTEKLAWAGNLDSFYLGNGAALQAGAVTADAEGGGAIWYNPAGLARLPGLRLDVSASAYALKLGGQPDISATGEGAKISRLETINFQIVPSALTLTHKAGDWGLGFGVFVPNQHTTFLRTRVDQPVDETGFGLDLSVDAYDRFQEYYAGPAFGVRLHPSIDFGVSLFVHYRNELSIGGLQADIETLGGTARLLTHETIDWQQLGAQWVLGLQLRPARDWRIGFTSRSGSFRLVNIRQSVRFEAVEGPVLDDGEELIETEFDEEVGFSRTQINPPRFHAGVSHADDDSRLAFDFNYQAPLRRESVQIDTRAVANARLGGSHALSETMRLGGGLFTDFSPTRPQLDVGERSIDYYGLTLAADFSSPYLISKRGDEKLSPPGTLLFGTTVALSYALGLGKLNQVQIGSGLELRGVKTDVVVHELVLHFGSSLSE